MFSERLIETLAPDFGSRPLIKLVLGAYNSPALKIWKSAPLSKSWISSSSVGSINIFFMKRAWYLNILNINNFFIIVNYKNIYDLVQKILNFFLNLGSQPA